MVTLELAGLAAPSIPVRRAVLDESPRKRVVLEAADELVLQCGQASITLRRNGRVVIRGVYIESRSKGTNRIKGGMVLIN